VNVQEPQTKAEMIEWYKAAHQKIHDAGIKHLKAVAMSERLKRLCEEQARRNHEESILEASRLIAKAHADRYSYEFILATVARAHGLSVAELKGPRRSRHIVSARMHAVHMIITMRPDLSLVFVGKAVGGRDHSTVINATQKWDHYKLHLGRQIAEVERVLNGRQA
jgi:chromosomal replication initiation ATPase DnaA